MTKKIIGLLSLLVFVLVSCNVQERIVFDDNMGGRYESSFDLSKMMSVANEMGGPSDPNKELTKMDTLVVFSEFIEEHKDSIATLSAEDRAKLEMLKDFTMAMKMDEATGEFKMDISKDFKTFSDLERVAYEIDNVFDQAKSEAAGGQQAAGPGGDLMSLDKVLYTFENNTFRRTDPKSITEHLEDEGLLKEETRLDLEKLQDNLEADENDSQEDAMMKGMMGQFAQEFENSTMKLEYTFPRKVVSVSPEGAVISEDGKTVTFEVPWSDLLEEKTKVLENFEVVLEDK